MQPRVSSSASFFAPAALRPGALGLLRLFSLRQTLLISLILLTGLILP